MLGDINYEDINLQKGVDKKKQSYMSTVSITSKYKS
jgi:hypothetical protein